MTVKQDRIPSSALPPKQNSHTTLRKSSAAKTDAETHSKQKPSPKKKQSSLIIQYEGDANNDSQDDENMFRPDSASSIIYKRAKNKQSIQNNNRNTSNIQQHTNILENQPEDMIINQDFEGVIHEEENLSKITLYNSNIAMQFTIPKAKAGPILAPMHNYELYLSQLQ